MKFRWVTAALAVLTVFLLVVGGLFGAARKTRFAADGAPRVEVEGLSHVKQWLEAQTGVVLHLSSDEVHRMTQSLRTNLERLVMSPRPSQEALLERVESSCELRQLHVRYSHKGGDMKSSIVSYVVVVPPGDHKPIGTLLLFHGCSHSSKDFCFASKLCENCIGLAEEVRFVVDALRMRLRVIAISSANKESRCWGSSRAAKVINSDSDVVWNNEDSFNVLQVLKMERIIGPNAARELLPMIAMGASSGGTFVASLPALIGEQLVGVVVQIAGARLSEDRSPSSVTGPSVIYSSMLKDARTASAAKTNADKLANERAAQRGTVLSKHEPSEYWVDPSIGVGYMGKPQDGLTNATLCERIPYFPCNASHAIFDALQSSGELVDAKTFRLKGDPRRNRDRWTSIVKPILDAHLANSHGMTRAAQRSLRDSLKADKSSIAEVLNVMYAFHEFYADDATSMLLFILKYAATSHN